MGFRKRKSLAVVTVLFLSAGGFVAFLLWPRADELSRWKSEMQARGENFSITELAPKFSLEKREFIKQLKASVSSLLGHPVGPGTIQLMTTQVPGYARVAWSAPFAAETSRTNVPWSALAEQIEGSRTAAGRIHELLRHVPAGSPCDYSDPANLGGTDLIAIRKAAHYLVLASMSDLHRGALDGALTNLYALISLASLHEEEGSLVFQMVRSAVAGLGTSATWEMLQAPGWDDARLAALDDAWARVGLLARMAPAFDIERAWILALYQVARTNASGPSALGGRTTGGVKQVFEDKIYTPLWQKAWSKTDELLYLRAIQPVGDAIRQGVTNRSWQVMSYRLQGAGEISFTNMTALDRFRYQLAGMASPNWSKALRALMRQETQIQLARAAIAIQRHRLRHGGAPAALAALVPKYLRETPFDYMTGRPLLYEINPDGSVALYSAGDDGHDDNALGDDVSWPQPGLSARVKPSVAVAKVPVFSINDEPAREVILRLARQTGIEAEFQPRIAEALPARFTLNLHDVTAVEALETVLHQLGLALVRGPKHRMSCVVTDPFPRSESFDDVTDAPSPGKAETHLKLEPMPLMDALLELARRAGVNAQIDPKLRRRSGKEVIADYREVSPEGALRLLAKEHGLRLLRSKRTSLLVIAEAERKD